LSSYSHLTLQLLQRLQATCLDMGWSGSDPSTPLLPNSRATMSTLKFGKNG
jgi:hypothetical protein